MSISPSSLQILSSVSLIPSSMTQALSANSTPAQLNQIASLTSQLNEEETLFGQPSTLSTAGTPAPTPDSVDLSNATLASLGLSTPPTTTSLSSTTTAPALVPISTSTGFSVLG